ncbi:hypothetical protein JX265_001589 [Neoarthrinium moseri]|uniref:SET domain-containing protein n=2 Tax=Neoarthrinium moseri TaxID=1658444 RepID=A0A9P9WVI4_9PEZI|nr:hypothetical protein JX265_001589 [Neoarthrinium moseri]
MSSASLAKLPFLEQFPPLDGLPHFRLILELVYEEDVDSLGTHVDLKSSVDKAIQNATIRTPFGPIISTSANEPARAVAESTDSNQVTTPDSTSMDDPDFAPHGGQSHTSQRQEAAATPSCGIASYDNQTDSANGHLQNSQDDCRSPEGDGGDRSPRSPTSFIDPVDHPESFRNEVLAIQPSPLAGLGAFALKDISRGQTILIERALFRANDDTLCDQIDDLKPSLRQAYERMHAYENKETSIGGRVFALFHTNSFNTGPREAGVFLVAARFNHACKPKDNILYVYDQRHKAIVFSAARDILAGEELTITYGKGPRELYLEYGFICKCGGCTSLTDEQIAAMHAPIDW